MKNPLPLIVASLCLLLACASIQAQTAPEVLSLKAEAMTQIPLDPIAPYPPESVLKGDQKNWMKTLHQGEIVVALYESTAAVIDAKSPYPYDEFIVVLEGEITLSHIDGNIQTFKAGENFFIPKGWQGTFEMSDNFREIIIVETKAWNNTEG
ncbi:MAG: cupin domain-containing protein [Pseudomonadales bacterium]